MRSFAQLSMEYLLLLAAAFAVFAMLLPLLNNVFELSLFGLDSANAKAFSIHLQGLVEEMSFQGNGSRTILEARPLSSWKLSSSGKTVFISVKGPSQREKTFEVAFPNNVGFSTETISNKTFFVLEKQFGEISFEHNNS